MSDDLRDHVPPFDFRGAVEAFLRREREEMERQRAVYWAFVTEIGGKEVLSSPHLDDSERDLLLTLASGGGHIILHPRDHAHLVTELDRIIDKHKRGASQ